MPGELAGGVENHRVLAASNGHDIIRSESDLRRKKKKIIIITKYSYSRRRRFQNFRKTFEQGQLQRPTEKKFFAETYADFTYPAQCRSTKIRYSNDIVESVLNKGAIFKISVPFHMGLFTARPLSAY